MYTNIDLERTIGGVDVHNFDSITKVIGLVKPDVVINCIGIVKQREEAKDPILSLRINSIFPHQLADICSLAGSRLFHMSTDCVFSGNKGNYSEQDLSDAEDLYGKTKYLGELNRKGCFTVRTSIIGREFINRSGLLEWFLSHRGGTVNGYVNAIFSGLTTQALADIIGQLIVDHPDLSGVYQIASPAISKFDLLSKLNQAMNLGIEIKPDENIRCDRSLNPAKFLRETKCEIPDWDSMVREVAADKTPYDGWRKN
jgi:dTDP-4-dehydrorhamnose reductase